MRIRIEQPTAIRLELQPGDELVLRHPPAEIERLLSASRLDGATFARVISDDGDELADLRSTSEETAVLKGRPPRGSSRTAVIPG